MKLKTLACVASAAVAIGSIQSALAQNWTGTGGNDLWSNAGNWDTGVPGTTTPNGVVIGTTVGGSETTEVTIAPGDVENCGTVGGNQAIFGPQWGSKLNIYGTLNLGFIIFPVQFDATPGNQSVINLYNGSAMNGLAGGNTLLLGDAWFYAAPYIVMNMYGNSTANFQYFSLGGHLNIYDTANLTITTFALVGPASTGFWGLAGPTDATRLLNLAGGSLTLPTGNTAAVQNWISRGWFVAYGKQFDTADITIVDNGTTTQVTVPPLGTLVNIALNQPRTNMMVGTFQNPVAIGNYTGFSGAVLQDLNSNQLSGATVTYHSSNPSVASIDAFGHVVALTPGTTTISATLGVMTSTNSAIVTVVSYTNSLVHRYSFSESSGTTTADSVGGHAWDGTLSGGASLGSGTLTLYGSSGYVTLPAGLVSNLDAVTIEAWVNFGAPAAFAPLYAFGNQDTAPSPLGENYLMFQPFTGAAVPASSALFGIGDPGSADEQDAIMPLVSGGQTNYLGNVFLTVVYHPYAGFVAFYTNGVLAMNNPGATAPLAATLADDPLNYLGLSLYASDPFMAGSINEFRIYNGPLTAAQIRADYALGPNQLVGTTAGTSLSIAPSGNNVTFSWSTNSALVNLITSPTLGAGANWTSANAAVSISGGKYQATLPAVGRTQFFRLQQY